MKARSPNASPRPVAARFPLWPVAVWLVIGGGVGCGTTKIQEATEQLVLSAAVDSSIAAIDFRPLSGYRVYFDDTYIKAVKSNNFVNAEYVISSMRQQIIAAGCKLQEKAELADVIIEGRIGTLGADDHRVTYGIPENNFLGVASTFVAPVGAPTATIPELAIARRDAREGAAKVAAFAYDRETREPVWQSGTSRSIATSRNTWVLGIGPFQGGSIRESTAIAKQDGKAGAGYVKNMADVNARPPVNYSAEVKFQRGWPLTGRPSPRNDIDGFTPAPELAGLPPAASGGLIESRGGDSAAVGSAKGGSAAGPSQNPGSSENPERSDGKGVLR